MPPNQKATLERVFFFTDQVFLAESLTIMSFPSHQKRMLSHVPRQKIAALENVYDGSDILSRHHQRTDEKCSIKDFTNKRREMLMLNMSINTQQEEIDKLHTDLVRRETNLKEKEADLTENLKRFDSFLMEEYNQKLMAANLLDKQLEEREAKTSLAKQLSWRMNILESGIRKQTDTIEQSKYKQLSVPLHQQKTKEKEKQGINHQTQASESEFEGDKLNSSGEECPPYFEDLHLLDAIQLSEEKNWSLAKQIQERVDALHELETR